MLPLQNGRNKRQWCKVGKKTGRGGNPPPVKLLTIHPKMEVRGICCNKVTAT